jgi:predicted lipoprotein with Yx(FWY)xxD motif
MVLLGLVVGACGGGSSSSAPPSSSGGGTGAVAVGTGKVSGLGTVLVNGQRHTLYTFALDKAKEVSCTGACASVWSPLKLTSGQKPKLSGGVKTSLVSSVPDPSGGRVVTYAGWPLYTYAADSGPAMAQGQALNSSGGLWYVITPAGQVIKKKSGAGSSSGNNSYCLAVTARIATPDGPVRVDHVKRGMAVWSTDRQGRRIRVTVLRVHHVHVDASHLMVRLRLADGRTLLGSLGHPLANGEPIGKLVAGERFQGSRIVSVARVRYGRPYTYDLLPAGPTHTYFADGVLLGSTLAPAAQHASAFSAGH